MINQTWRPKGAYLDKQHRASCKKIEERTVREPLELLHMDLFGPVSVESVNKEEGTLSEEHYVQDDYTADPFFEDIIDKDAVVTSDIERKSDETEALERKSDETEEINVEEKEA
ncbi:hypothetical protein Tco_0479780, partial [Tanacetum coccineum]